MKVIILHRNSFDLIGGVESTIFYIADTLKKAGHTPVVVAKERKGSKDDNSFCKVVRYSGSSIPAKWTLCISPMVEYFNAKKKLKKVIEEEKPDYIITRDNILSYAISHFFDKNRIVYVPLGIIKYYNTGIRKFSGLKSFIIECIRFVQLKQESYFQIKAFKKLNKIVVFSRNMKNQIKRAIKDDSKVLVVHPGVSERFSPDFSECEIRKEFNIPHDKTIFLFVGRVVQEKNLRMLVDAYAKAQNDDSVLLIVGGGDDESYLKNKVKELGIADKVIFAGFRRDTEKFYREASFFVLPSYYESFGNVILESMASGTPVIGFKTEVGKTLTAIDELVENEKSGFICENFSEKALTDAINKAISMEEEKYKDMRKYCGEYAKENYTWDAFVSRVLGVLEGEEK